MTATFDRVPLERYLRSRRADIDAALEGFLPAPPACPPLMAEAMRYSLFAGGKRLRPILTLAAAEAMPGAQGRDACDLAMPAACAIEMIHTYSLIHDDLPAMDDDTMRRGRPTSHVVYGDGIAVLAGDALLTEAFGVLARYPRTDEPDVASRKVRALDRVAEASGVVGMVGGQAIDLEATGLVGAERLSTIDGALDGTALSAMHARKTGALIRAAAVAGALMAGAPATVVTAVDDYATHLGLAFQIVDDILDVEGGEAELGKTAGKDAVAGKPTYPAHYGVEESRRLAAQSIAGAKDALAAGHLGGRLQDIAGWVLTRSH